MLGTLRETFTDVTEHLVTSVLESQSSKNSKKSCWRASTGRSSVPAFLSFLFLNTETMTSRFPITSTTMVAMRTPASRVATQGTAWCCGASPPAAGVELRGPRVPAATVGSRSSRGISCGRCRGSTSRIGSIQRHARGSELRATPPSGVRLSGWSMPTRLRRTFPASRFSHSHSSAPLLSHSRAHRRLCPRAATPRAYSAQPARSRSTSPSEERKTPPALSPLLLPPLLPFLLCSSSLPSLFFFYYFSSLLPLFPPFLPLPLPPLLPLLLHLHLLLCCAVWTILMVNVLNDNKCPFYYFLLYCIVRKRK